ncbi:hypothetical protein LCGC14_1605720, partial [marine sediment metagenome]
TPAHGLPDPDTEAEFYADIPTKRLFAWLIDIVFITLISVVLVPLTLFTALFYFPVLMLCVGFAYRVVGLARHSATPGMRIMSVELRAGTGARFDLPMAFLHTTGYAVSMALFPLQMISAVLMLSTARAQGLTDHMLGSAAINRAARD